MNRKSEDQGVEVDMSAKDVPWKNQTQSLTSLAQGEANAMDVFSAKNVQLWYIAFQTTEQPIPPRPAYFRPINHRLAEKGTVL